MRFVWLKKMGDWTKKITMTNIMTITIPITMTVNMTGAMLQGDPNRPCP